MKSKYGVKTRQIKSGFSRLGGFAASSLISGAVNVATIPVVVGAIGAQHWAAIAAGQAVGVIGSIFIQLGWGVTGPAQIAATKDRRERTRIYRESLYYRFAVLPPVLIAVAFTSWVVVPPAYSLDASIAGVGSALMGLTASWYFVGKGDALSLLRLDTVPRAVSVAGGAAVLAMFPNAILFALAILLSSILPLILASRSIGREAQTLKAAREVVLSWTRGKELFYYQWPGIISSIVSQSYKFLPLILISAVRPDQAAVYALMDRIVKFAIAAIKPVAQSLQSWVPAAGNERLRARIWTAMAVSGVAGTSSSILFIALGPLAVSFLGAGDIEISPIFLVPAALILVLSALTQTGMLSLLALGRRSLVALSVSFGGFTGLALLVPAVVEFGAVGGLYSLAVAEMSVLCIQLLILIRARGDSRLVDKN